MELSKIGRIDKAVADNRNVISESFFEDAPLVQDFIVFIMKNMKEDLFGYTEFTLNQFCEATGNSRQGLSSQHPVFSNSANKTKKRPIRPPEKDGFVFETRFDYALYSMVQRNLVLSKGYTTREGNQVVSLESIGILKDVVVDIGPRNQRIYKVKLSPDLIKGFASRYYTVDLNIYKLISKGSRGAGSMERKGFIIYLCKIRHLLQLQGKDSEVYPVDVLAAEAGIMAKESFHTKQNLNRLLEKIAKLEFPYKYEFLSKKKGHAAYYVQLTFTMPDKKVLNREHGFFYALIDELGQYYNSTYGSRNFKETEPFQQWLANENFALEVKVPILKRLYEKFFEFKLSDDEAIGIIKNGFLSSSKDKDSDRSIDEDFKF